MQTEFVKALNKRVLPGTNVLMIAKGIRKEVFGETGAKNTSENHSAFDAAMDGFSHAGFVTHFEG